MTVSEIIEMYDVNDPSEKKVSKLSDALGCSESDATKLIQSSEVLRTMYKDECNTPRAEENHSWAKERLKKYVSLRLDDAGGLVPYFNSDPRGPAVKVMRLDVAGGFVSYFNSSPCGHSVKVMVQDEDGKLNVHSEDDNLYVHKPWKFVPEDWPFLVSLSNEAYIPDLRN